MVCLPQILVNLGLLCPIKLEQRLEMFQLIRLSHFNIIVNSKSPISRTVKKSTICRLSLVIVLKQQQLRASIIHSLSCKPTCGSSNSTFRGQLVEKNEQIPGKPIRELSDVDQRPKMCQTKRLAVFNGMTFHISH